MRTLLSLAGRNVFRNRRRTLRTLIVVAGGVTGLLLVGGFFAYLFWGFRETTIQNGVGHPQIYNAEFFERDETKALENGLENYQDVIAVAGGAPHVNGIAPRMEFFGMVSNGMKSGTYMATAVLPAAEERMGFRPNIVEGRGLTHTGEVRENEALIRQFDSLRNGWDSFVVRVKITNFEKGRPDEEHLFEVYQKGAEKTYVEFLSPRDKGRHLLMLGDDMWIYLPDTSRPMRITPLERLAGNASNGDVARTNYAVDYDGAYLRSEKVNGADCHVLKLNARRKGATYRKVRLWIGAADGRPLQADFFLGSGKHAKSATYDAYEDTGGGRVLRRVTIRDRIRNSSHSVMEYSDWRPRQLPDRMFHQGWAGRF